ncbi:MAG: hypothetical protein HND58_17365 [Planctomycetota bacterium]|nr:MAG: hypothetical protein HND58_17365 [Planctomycetota bacterium]
MSAWVFDQPRGESMMVLSWSAGGPRTWGKLAGALRSFREEGDVRDGLEEARGWPALAFWMEYRGFSAYGSGGPLTVFGGVPLEPSVATGNTRLFGTPNAATVRAVPYLPIWPGLAFNTLFYALLWWLAFASVRMVRHNRRYRRGLCPMCRYDLLADYSGGCSECGWNRT